MRQVVPSDLHSSQPPFELNTMQQQARQHIDAKLNAPDGRPILLHGVTGSGKTEVYIQAVASILEQNKSALILTPEISLTSQLVERFAIRYPSQVAVLHSGLSDGERFDEWRRLSSGHARIAIGARSAVFAPLPQLGLIIVDEEHDTSYKQEETPRYNARDVAIVRAHQNSAVVILGSATPALETFHHAQSGKYSLLSLPKRVEEKPLPQVTVIDQRKHATAAERVITTPLYQAIADRLERQEQILILMNRRGFASYIQCHDCGEAPQCLHCSVSLTYHRHARVLRCHYCDFTQPVPSTCGSCKSVKIQPFGIGTQQVEESLKTLFPAARLARMDRDTTRRKAAHQRILKRLREGELDILVGTQMIAKGHDFPNITLVGVVAADATLAVPDFRSPERLFQLLTQVAGRAGRGEVTGDVIIQTYRPDHYSVQFAKQHDFVGFFDDEIKHRQPVLYPPYTRLARVILQGPSQDRLQQASYWIAEVLQHCVSDRHRQTMLGPAEAPISRLRDHYRWHFLLKATTSQALHQWLRAALSHTEGQRQQLQGIRISVDIDPVSFI
jgi:primosomal protein N' (replication factor Y)